MHYEMLEHSEDVSHHNGMVSQVVRDGANQSYTRLYVAWRGVEILPDSTCVSRSGAFYHTVGAQCGN